MAVSSGSPQATLWEISPNHMRGITLTARLPPGSGNFPALDLATLQGCQAELTWVEVIESTGQRHGRESNPQSRVASPAS